MTPSATALTRTPRARVLDGEGPGHGRQPALGEHRQRGGAPAVGVIDEAGGDVDDMAASLAGHVPNDGLGDVEEAGQVHAGDGEIFVHRVVRERFADEHPRIVDEGVDPSEPIERLLHHLLAGLDLGDVTRHGEDVVVFGGTDGARRRDDRVPGTAEGNDQPGADPPRRPRDDGDLSPSAIRSRWCCGVGRRGHPTR